MCEETLQQAIPYLLDARYMGPGQKNPKAFNLHGVGGGVWGRTHTEAEIRTEGDAMRDCHFKKYIHLKTPFQPFNHYQKIKQSFHIVLFFGAVPWAWAPLSCLVCHCSPSAPQASPICTGGGEGLQEGRGGAPATKLGADSDSSSAPPPPPTYALEVLISFYLVPQSWPGEIKIFCMQKLGATTQAPV